MADTPFDADIPERFRGTDHIAVFELRAQIRGKTHDALVAASGPMLRPAPRNTVELHFRLVETYERAGMPVTIGKSILLRGVSPEGCRLIEEQIPKLVRLNNSPSSDIQQRTNLSRDTILSLLRDVQKRRSRRSRN